MTIDKRMLACVKSIVHRTDLWPWYWLACGEKCYCFQVVEAYVLNGADEFPPPGSRLEFNEAGKWIGENGSEMEINDIISEIEAQNGDAICEFIAYTHAFHLSPFLITSI